jgi:NADP-dependent 3-hydroxy acid dehydrogenase YdfG
MANGVEGKVVAITGASSGIGAATAELLAEQGGRVVLGARRPERLADLAARITAAGGAAVYRPTDVRRRADLAALTGLATERYGRLDVMVSNVGVGLVSPLDDLRVDDWDEMIDTNIKGVLYGIAAALPLFRRQGSGQFVHVASTAAYKTVPAQAVYSGTKVAVRAISEGLRQEAGADLRVTVVSPGFTNTDFVHGATDPGVRAQFIETRDRLAIPPAAVARAIAFAISQPPDVDVNEIVVRPTAQA